MVEEENVTLNYWNKLTPEGLKGDKLNHFSLRDCIINCYRVGRQGNCIFKERLSRFLKEQWSKCKISFMSYF